MPNKNCHITNKQGIYNYIHTPLGIMLAIANHQALLFLQFINNHLESEDIIFLFKQKNQYILTQGTHDIIDNAQHELQAYFKGVLTHFTVPIQLLGTSFQQDSWNQLLTIPYGQTISYHQQANNIQRPRAYRAVAQANKANNITIIIPCHRVIQKNNSLGGYRTGINRKTWLLYHENKYNVT